MRVVKTISPDNKKISFAVVDKNFKIIEEILLFTHYLEIKNISLNTIEQYCRNLKEYFIWLESEQIKFYDVQPKNIINFISYLDKKNETYSANTLNNILASVSSFYQYYETIGGYIERNPVSKSQNNNNSFIVHKVYKNQVETSYFKRKTRNKTKVKRLLPQQVSTLYHSVEQCCSNEEIYSRNKLLFKLLYESGMRIGECLGLRLNDYSEPDPSKEFGEIYVVRHDNPYHKDHSVKTNERIIPVSMDLIFELDEYVCNYRPQFENIDTIFVNHGNRNNGTYMKRSNITKFFNQLSSITGIHFSAHSLRHTHASELAEFGYDQLYISNRLGHSSIESTNKYVHISLESQIDAYARFINQRKGRLI